MKNWSTVLLILGLAAATNCKPFQGETGAIVDALKSSLPNDDDGDPYQDNIGTCPQDSISVYIYDILLNEGSKHRCVCKPCPRPKCPHKVAVEVSLGNGKPGSCCPIYKCENQPKCDNKKPVVYYTNSCTKCNSCRGPCQQLCDPERSGCYVNSMDKLVKDGESWNENNGCIHCTCVDGEQKCIITECRTPNCDNPVTHIGQCCATCLDEPDDQHKHVLLTSDNSMTTEPSIAVSNAIQENVESTTKSSNVDYSGTDSVGSNVSPQITSEASNSKQWKVESTTTTFNYVRKTDTASTIPNETSESTISKEIGSTPLDSSTTTTTENSQISSIVSISIEKNVESTNNASNINIIFDIVRTKNASDASTPLPESTASATTINREIGSSSTNSMGTENSSTSPTPIQESTTSASKINGEIGTASTTVMDRTRPASTATPENEEITTKTSRISAESVESSSTPKVANALTTDNINNRTHNYGKEIIESSSPASNIGRDISMKTTEHPDRRTEAPELQTPESTSQHKDRNINESDFRIATSGTNPPFQINEFSGIWLYAGIAVACIVFVLCILLFWLCCCKNRPKIYSSVPNSEFNLNKPITTELVSTTKI